MGLSLLLSRGVQAECDRRQSRLLQHESGVAGLVCAEDCCTPGASEAAHAAQLTTIECDNVPNTGSKKDIKLYPLMLTFALAS